MKYLTHILILILCQLFIVNCFAQSYADKNYFLVDNLILSTLTKSDHQLVDSCLKIYHAAQHDTDKINAINIIVESSWDANIWSKYNDWIYTRTKSIIEENPSSNLFYKRVLANSINNKGYLANQKGEIPDAINFLNQALMMFENLNDLKGESMVLISLGAIYDHQQEYKHALHTYSKAINIQNQLGDIKGKSYTLNNLANTYSNINKLDSSLYYHRISYNLRKELNDIKGIGYSLINIGGVFKAINEHDSAIVYFHKSLEVEKKLSNKFGEANSLNNLSEQYLITGMIDSALHYAELGYAQSVKQSVPILIRHSSLVLYRLRKHQNNYLEALELYELHIQMRDSINNLQTQKAAIRQQTKYEFEKVQLVKEQQLKEESLKLKEETERRDNIQYSIIFIAILAVFGTILSLGFITVSPKFAEGLIFFAFLIFFEFCLVLLDPYIDDWSNGEPAYKLLFNAVLAGAIFPAHAFFEHLLKKRLLQVK